MKKYSIIYADPPWKYRNNPNRKSPEAHYPTMPPEAIKALPVAQLADEDCVLFLWATMPKLREALEVMAAWGFRYRTVAEALLGDRPRIELFARRRTPGWDVWGNEVESDAEADRILSATAAK